LFCHRLNRCWAVDRFLGAGHIGQPLSLEHIG
jgi:hypothetical protein